jgi:two-component system, chemotaxis family, CheB/CheR fusion protein
MSEEQVEETPSDIGDEAPQDEAGFELLLDFLHRSRGFDFGGYKRQTLTRRVLRRMQTVGQSTFAGYIDYLQVRPDEFAQLFNAILINVTGFFRDPNAWHTLSEHVARLVEEKDENEPIRVWTAGCASGEEAYSLAIVLAELLGIEGVLQRAKIYATDLDDEALTQARLARYTPKSVEQVPPRLLETYFTHVGSAYVFHKDLRRAVIFGRHDLLQDAPISRVDILTCRNTLMYFNSETQARVLSRLHFALANKGIFFLGKAEMLLTHTTLFTPIDLKLRLFRRTSRAQRPLASRVAFSGGADEDRLGMLRRSAFDASNVAQIILDTDNTVALINPRAASLFGLVEKDVGRAFHELEISYRPVELRSIIDRVASERRPVSIKAVERAAQGSGTSYLDIDVAPLRSDSGELAGIHLVFTDSTFVHTLQAELHKVSLELIAAHEELQSTSEELETTNEELQSTVEELETTNEELQSTVEELETMNEELQSTNEELQTLNEELRQRSDTLNDANTFLSTVLQRLRCGIVVLDADLGIKAWNQTMEELWGVSSKDAVGKSVLGLDIGIPVDKLRSELREIAGGGTEGRERMLDCVNRRGKSLRCRCSVQPLRDGSFSGAMLIVDVVEEG